MNAQCEMMIAVYVDAQGNDLCESLDLPAYPMYQCMERCEDGSDMCLAHDAWASHWDVA